MKKAERKDFFIPVSGGKSLFATYYPAEQEKALVIIMHGMQEHCLRYERFATLLAENGFSALAFDARGAGKTAECPEDLGFIAEENGFALLVEDAKIVAEYGKNVLGAKTVVFFGHSFGSFVAQGLMEKYPSLCRIYILSGTSGRRLPEARILAFFVKVLMVFAGKRHRPRFCEKLGLIYYNRRIKERPSGPAGNFAWTTRYTELSAPFFTDPLCAYVPTLAFYRDLAEGLCIIHKPSAMEAIPKDISLGIFSGGDDPVGQYGKGVEWLKKNYEALAITDVSVKIYNGARHEVLNEINRDRVESDMINWLKKRC